MDSKPIKISPSYSIDENGNVYNKHGRKLKLALNHAGYPVVKLKIEGIFKNRFIHKLVAVAFIEHVEGKWFINHINGIKTDNKVSNLEWCTKGENLKHAYKLGLRYSKGESHPNNRFTEKDIKEIRKLLEKGVTQKEIGILFGVTQPQISAIKLRKTWKHI